MYSTLYHYLVMKHLHVVSKISALSCLYINMRFLLNYATKWHYKWGSYYKVFTMLRYGDLFTYLQEGGVCVGIDTWIISWWQFCGQLQYKVKGININVLTFGSH